MGEAGAFERLDPGGILRQACGNPVKFSSTFVLPFGTGFPELVSRNRAIPCRHLTPFTLSSYDGKLPDAGVAQW